MIYGKCRKCGRRLTDPESRARGFGPECWEEITLMIRRAREEAENAPVPGQMSIFDFLPEEEENINA